jgi:hypothetical protein
MRVDVHVRRSMQYECICCRWLRWDAPVTLQGQPSLFHHLPQFHGLSHVPPFRCKECNAAHVHRDDRRVSVHVPHVSFL